MKIVTKTNLYPCAHLCHKSSMALVTSLLAAGMILAAADHVKASVVITYNSGGANVYQPYDGVVSATDAANAGSSVLSSLSLTSGSAIFGSSTFYMNDGIVYDPATMNDRGNTTWTLTPTDGAQLTIDFTSALDIAVINTFAMSGGGQARSAQDYGLEYFAGGSWTSLFTNLNTSAPNNINAGNTTTWVNLDLTSYAGGALSGVTGLRFTFRDINGLQSMYREVDVFATGAYWAPSAGGGGTGTWSTGVNNWAVTEGTQGSGPQSSTRTLFFGNTAGTVTVSNGVNVAAGMTFSTDGYTVTNSTITLTGGNAASNTITTAASVGATVSSQLAGANGMTKAGAGTLILSASNTVSGGSTLSAGALRAAHANALGTGSLVASAGTVLQVTNSINISNNLSVYNVRFLDGGNTLSGTITNNNTVYDVNAGEANTLTGYLTGTNGMTKAGAGTLTIAGSGANALTGTTLVSEGTLQLDKPAGGGWTTTYYFNGAQKGSTYTWSTNPSIDGVGIVTYNNAGTSVGSFDNFELKVQETSSVIYSDTFTGSASNSLSGQTTTTGGGTWDGASDDAIKADGSFAGTGQKWLNWTPNAGLVYDLEVTINQTSGNWAGLLFKPTAGAPIWGGFGASGVGTMLDVDESWPNVGGIGANGSGTYMIRLDTTSSTAIAGNLEVAAGATLLLSQSDQVMNTAAVTLSGGTIQRGSGVSEIFGNLNVTGASYLDFGSGAAGNFAFGTYAASALLTVNNFLPGNKLQFASGFDASLLPTGGNLSNGNFSFSNGFTTGTEGGFFTITAIPEPSTVLAALGLAGLMLWPAAKRLRCPATSTRKG